MEPEPLKYDQIARDPFYPAVIRYHPEVDILFKCGARLPGPPVFNGINPVVHVILELNAREAVDGPGFPEAQQAMKRLKGEGLSEHACLWAIGQLTVTEIYGAVKIDDAHNAQFRRRLGLLTSRPLTSPMRNEPCPCGSGLKSKKCCLPVFYALRASTRGGELDLGVGRYALSRVPRASPASPVLCRMENRAHIADYLKGVGLLDEALASLQENHAEAEFLQDDATIKDALMDLVELCLSEVSLAATGIEYCRKLLQLPMLEEIDPRGRDTVHCDLAELLGRAHGFAEGLAELDRLIAARPDIAFFRYRKALYLLEDGRRQDAKTLLVEVAAVSKGEYGREVAAWAKDVLKGEFGRRP